jgi:peptidoglycan/LPS O-acetylase OafA/YrhL
LSCVTRSSTPTVADLILSTGGRSSGFDYLRVTLALSVVVWHSVVTSYGTSFQSEIWNSPWRSVVGLILPMFFALSGFLVAGSLSRNALPTFLGLRALRIMPALGVEICLSALILGPLLTTVPLIQYFSDSKFYSYFLNLFGDVHFFLPGLFADNPFPAYVNGQLWTIPFELECYLLLAIFAAAGIFRRTGLFVFATFVLHAVWTGQAIFEAYAQGALPLSGSTVPGNVLPLCFLAGVVLYLLRDRVRASWPLCLAALAVSSIALQVPFGDFLISFPVAYLTIFLGLLNPRRLPLRGGDYSYGIFLYGFPIQQLVASQGTSFHRWYVNLAIAVPLTVAFAALSWNFVESPALLLRLHLRRLDAWCQYAKSSLNFSPFRPIPESPALPPRPRNEPIRRQCR